MSADSNTAPAPDLDELSFNMESVDEMVGEIEGNDLICENEVSGVVNDPYPVDEKRKKEFEINREDIISRVPGKAKKRFGEICFGSFAKFTGPVLVMSPYSVAPGPLRDNWLEMFKNVSFKFIVYAMNE
jgi:hypothetical protein